MALKHMKSCLPTLTTVEIQIKMRGRRHLSVIRLTKFWACDSPLRHPHTLLGRMCFDVNCVPQNLV